VQHFRELEVWGRNHLLTLVAYGRYHSVSEGDIVRAAGPGAALYERSTIETTK
jgi:hypothetical protein